MKKVTKKGLEQRINLLSAENSELHEYLMRIKRALKSIDIDILSKEFANTEPKLKQLDQSVFDGLDAKWRFAAVDGERGIVTVFDLRPIPSSCNNYHTNTGEGNYKDLYELTGYDTSNWQNSLIERDIAKELLEVDLSSELTGSDLCRAMLERGDKYVLCFVSDFSDDCAVNQSKMINLVTHKEGNSIFAKSARWKYAVPINQQTGEPLTAAEVGL